MTTAGSAREPKYQRIAGALRRDIAEGRYAPGERLPGENDLMAEHAVARMTARQALAVLQAEGLAEARKGAGVFVREFEPIRRRGIQRLSPEQWGSGRSVWDADIAERDLAVEVIAVSEVSGDEVPSAVVNILGTAEVWLRRRRFVLDGKPVMLSVSYFPAALVAGTPITETDTGPGGAYARLAERGHAPEHFREEIRSRMPTADEALRLKLAAGTPVMLIWRTAFSAEGTAVEVNEMMLDAASYVLEYDFEG
ncbi:transcriptional regulator, GntR family [Actinacidiphila rubida]|uniref:Transcriptional regulator, GntR family n=2 Tax=Actinacidiphila rubida TaxID=310780 RepID=A0A1H8N9P9_9ACTN|nr:GntR family transcriptional regulator [Actinacidiphila rubida]SEO26179.1 transcriptional regulator, GntR family [Actinacidiphila rubida]